MTDSLIDKISQFDLSPSVGQDWPTYMGTVREYEAMVRELICQDYGGGAVQSAAEAHNVESADSTRFLPAKEGDACIPLAAPAKLASCEISVVTDKKLETLFRNVLSDRWCAKKTKSANIGYVRKYLIEAIRPYLRTSKPVSVSLSDVMNEAYKATMLDVEDLKAVIKCAYDAAGVSYVK